jgi:hypothetical protein
MMKKRLALLLALVFYVSVLPPLTRGAVITPHFSDIIVKGPYIDVRWFDATDSVTLAGVQAAVDAAVGKPVLIPSGVYSFSGTVTLPNAAIRIIGDNAVITQSGSVPTFLQENHVYTEISGIEFRGNGNGIKFNMAPSASMYKDYLIDRCRFITDSGVYGLYLVGPREGYVTNSYFEGPGSGIYLQSATSPLISNCIFKGSNPGGNGIGNAIYYDGDGLGTSAGMVITDTVILGWENGLYSAYCDWLQVKGSTIDYNDNSVVLLSQDDGDFTGNYIGGSSIYNNPAIRIGTGTGAVGTPDYSNHISFNSNVIHMNYNTDNTADAVQISGTANDIRFANNLVYFWNRYGISVGNSVTYFRAMGNAFAPRTGLGTAAITNNGGGADSTWLIYGNSFDGSKTVTNMSFAWIKENPDFPTNWSGAVALDNVASVLVDHNLSVTPSSITTTSGANHPIWVDNVSATSFTVNTDNVYSAFSVYWRAEKMRGN